MRWGKGFDRRGIENFKVVEMFYILIGVVDMLLYTFAKLRDHTFKMGKFYLSKLNRKV